MPPRRVRLHAGMRVLVLDSDSWREMGIARALDRAADVTPVLERDLGDQTWSKSLASVILLSEGAARSDTRRSLSVVRRKFPHAKILVHGDQSDPSVIADFVAQGADGYFALSLGEENLIKAIRVVARGSVWLPEKAISTLVQRVRRSGRSDALGSSDHALLRMLNDGLTNKEMAAQIGVAEITVKTRLARLYRRCGVRSRVQLLAFAHHNGLLPKR
jgi:DNA-binding NarL/FixJ family response regulator